MIGGMAIMKQDSQTPGNPLRTKLRALLGIEDPGEPAPWMPGGAWHPAPLPRGFTPESLGNVPSSGGVGRPGQGFTPQSLGIGTQPKVDTQSLDDACNKANSTGKKLKDSLNITTRPLVDTAELDTAINKLNEIKGLLGTIGSFTARPTVAPNVLSPIGATGGGQSPALQRASAVTRSAHSDYGIRDI